MGIEKVLIVNALQGFVTTSNPTYTPNSAGNFSIDTSGGLRVHVISSDVGGAGGTASSFGAVFPAIGTAIGVKNGVSMVGLTADNTGNLNVNLAASSGTITITGNVNASQNGVWTVQPGNTANTTAWKVDGSAVTQPVSGTLSVSNFPATQPVSGTVAVSNLPATQTVAGSVSVSNFPATQPVSGTVTANQGGTWTVQPGNTVNTVAWKVDGSAVTQPISGSVAVSNLPATQIVDGSAVIQPVKQTNISLDYANRIIADPSVIDLLKDILFELRVIREGMNILTNEDLEEQLNGVS